MLPRCWMGLGAPMNLPKARCGLAIRITTPRSRCDFTYLANLSGSQYQAKAGDIVQGTIVGHVITAYKNGVKMGQATDSVYASGKPGMGFNEQENGDYGYSEFTATDESVSILRRPSVLRIGAMGTAAFPWRDVLGRSSKGSDLVLMPSPPADSR